MYQFNSAQEAALIAKGTHFYCWGCLTAVPVELVSDKTDYCRECMAVLKAERDTRTKEAAGRWHDQRDYFIIGDKKYGVDKIGRITCAEVPQDAPVSDLTSQEVVSKLPDNDITPPAESPSVEVPPVLKQKHARGRPRKADDEEMTRVTAWRHRKYKENEQMALIEG